MADAPLVTIGVPTRNGGRTLRCALESARAQDHPNLEIVVSDNASDDDTAAIVAAAAEEDPRVRVVRQDHPLTMIRNHEAVWREAKGEYFVFLADDDLL